MIYSQKPRLAYFDLKTLSALRITILLNIKHFNQTVRHSLVGICANFQGHESKE